MNVRNFSCLEVTVAAFKFIITIRMSNQRYFKISL